MKANDKTVPVNKNFNKCNKYPKTASKINYKNTVKNIIKQGCII